MNLFSLKNEKYQNIIFSEPQTPINIPLTNSNFLALRHETFQKLPRERPEWSKK